MLYFQGEREHRPLGGVTYVIAMLSCFLLKNRFLYYSPFVGGP